VNDTAAIVLCLPEGVRFSDPDPEATLARDVRVVPAWTTDAIGIVGWSDGGLEALRLASQHPNVPRLAIASLPYPGDSDVLATVDRIRSKTLLLFGQQDERTGSKHGRSWQRRLAGSRLEMVPNAGHDLLPRVWPRVLSHVAPGRRRRPQ
jgi:pimeloyl-ACP methyl ester carboxylesterase